MIITNISLKNFKQFYGEQKVEIAHDEKKNVTVIYGANGRGKTSLFRAIMFCLYGEKRLAQDPEESEEELKLVNKVAIEEAVKTRKKEIESYVQIDFIHEQKKYSLKRCVLGIKIGDEHVEQLGDVQLSIINKSNCSIEKNIEKIEEIINSILDKRVREYFLFDGEKMERLTRFSREQKREIENGIKNLLNINQLAIANKGLSLLLKHSETQLKNKATGIYQQELIKLEAKETEKQKLESELQRIDKELGLAESELKSVDQKLDQYKGIKELLKKRADSTRDLELTKAERNDLLTEMLTVNDDLGVLLIENELEEVSRLLGEKIEKQELPSPIRERLVNKILKDGICICKNKIDKDNPEALKNILEWKDKLIDEQVEQNLFSTYGKIGGTLEFIKHKVGSVQRSLQDYANKSEQIENYEKELKKISEQIGEQKIDEDIPRLEKSRTDVVMKKGKLEQQYNDTKDKMHILKEEMNILSENVKKLEKEEGVKNNLAKRCNLVRVTRDALTEIYEEFTKEIKEKIGAYATEIFHKLIDEEGNKTFKQIKVSEDYSLELYDWQDKPFLANISAGQRQVTSISFIAALAKIAGNEKNTLEIPLFMDTPFGRLSGEHRDRLLENIPDLTKQWILLATDTEFTKEESQKLKTTGRWGKIYTLEGNKPGFTSIVEKNVNTFTPQRTTATERRA